MKRFLFGLLAFSIIFAGCDGSKFKDILRVNLKGAEIYSEGEDAPFYYVQTGKLVFSKRNTDKYWYIRIEILFYNPIQLGPENFYTRDGTLYRFSEGDVYVELDCGSYPRITACNSSHSKLSFTPDVKTARRISFMLDKNISYPIETINAPSGASVADPAAPAAEALEWDEDEDLMENYDEWFPSHSVEVDEGTSYADSSYGRLIVEGDYTQTGQFHRGIGMFGASFSAPPVSFHITMYEKVLIRTFPDNSSSKFLYDSELSKSGYRVYHDASGAEWWIGYNPQNNSFFIETEMDGYRWDCDIVPAGSYNNSSTQGIQNNTLQNYTQDNSAREMMYRNQYETWERTVQRNWEMLTTMRNGAASTSVRMNFRDAQSQMRNIRQNAQIEGIHIPQSAWETASVPYSLYDD